MTRRKKIHKHKHRWRKVGGEFNNQGDVENTKKKCIVCGETKYV